MKILERFKTIMSSNINALLDKAEDPAKMADQLLRDLTDDLGRVKAETAGIMAEEKRARRELDDCRAQTEKMQAYAEKAVAAGNDDDARRFLSEKAALTQKQAALQQAYDLSAANSDKMRQMHDRLTGQINELNARRDAVKAKVAVAKAQERANQMRSGVSGAQGNLDAFDAMERKANQMLDEANAMAELNAVSEADDLDALASKYDKPANHGVEDELAALKAKLGQ